MLGRQSLSREEEKRHLQIPRRFDPSRRDFLLQCCQGATAALVPPGLRRLAFSSAYAVDPAARGAPFHLHPHYREQRPIDALLLRTQAGLDSFPSEKYADEVEAILTQWSAGLLRSPTDLRAIESVLAPDFSGTSFKPFDTRIVRSDASLEVSQNTFSNEVLPANVFVRDLQAAVGSFSRVLTAEFQVANIELAQPTAAGGIVKTRVRYDLVGSREGFYREQRVGYWELEWRTAAGQLHLRSWRGLNETRSRATDPVFVDVTAGAFGSNTSYRAQLLHGSDYWRTVLDGACGIDIYGHNGISVGDIDDDGFDDLYVCQPAGLPNRLYRNRGDGTFEDITESSRTANSGKYRLRAFRRHRQ